MIYGNSFVKYINLAPKFTDDVCQLTIEQMQDIQNQAILEIWEEWEEY